MGESMADSRRKGKKLLVTGAASGAVYVVFRYFLPLAGPFFAGYILALVFRPSARFLSYRLCIRLRGRDFHLPIGIAGGAEFLAALGAAGILCYEGGIRLLAEGKLFMARMPVWLEQFDVWLTGSCYQAEAALGLSEGCVADLAGHMIQDLFHICKEGAMPFFMANSVSVIGFFAKWMVMALVTFLAAVLSLQEMENLRCRRDDSIFCREFHIVGKRLIQTGKAWIKSQGVIFALVSGLCMAGLFFLKSPYCIMGGLGLGLVDALPVLGVGTVLIPWALIQMFLGKWKSSLILFALYLMCYFLRQVLEMRLMGGQVGLSPLETLASVYVGLELFGFFGFLLGPLGLLLIEDLVKEWEESY